MLLQARPCSFADRTGQRRSKRVYYQRTASGYYRWRRLNDYAWSVEIPAKRVPRAVCELDLGHLSFAAVEGKRIWRVPYWEQPHV